MHCESGVRAVVNGRHCTLARQARLQGCKSRYAEHQARWATGSAVPGTGPQHIAAMYRWLSLGEAARSGAYVNQRRAWYDTVDIVHKSDVGRDLIIYFTVGSGSGQTPPQEAAADLGSAARLRALPCRERPAPSDTELLPEQLARLAGSAICAPHFGLFERDSTRKQVPQGRA